MVRSLNLHTLLLISNKAGLKFVYCSYPLHVVLNKINIGFPVSNMDKIQTPECRF